MAANGSETSFGGDGKVLQLDSGGVCPILQIYQKNHRIVQFKRANFMVRELYFNKIGV